MTKTLRYLRTRVFSTKDSRQLRPSDVTDRTSYSSAIDLTTVSLGSCLSVGCLVVVGQVAKTTAGPAVIIATLIAAIVTLLITLHYAELQSRHPRVQSSSYEHVFHAAGESAAFYVAWSQMTSALLYSAAISRAVSANIDAIAGGVIYKFTVARTGDIFLTDKYLDFIGFLFVLLLLLYVALGGRTQFCDNKFFYTGTNAIVFGALMFLAMLGAFHFNFQLWHPKHFFGAGLPALLRGASMLVPILLSQKMSLTLCDFMWLGIKPTILATIAMTTVLSLLSLLGMSGILTLVSDPGGWMGDATVSATFQAAGVTWVKYVISPVAVFMLAPYALLYLLDSINCMQMLCNDQLVHAGLGYLWNEASLPLLSVLLLSVLSAFCALLFSMELCLKIAAIVTLLETLLVCSVTMAMRNKPQQQQQQQGGDTPETSTLIDSPQNALLQPDTYGALPRLSNAASPTSPRPDDEDNIDEAVEEYRLQAATQQCYQGTVHSSPTNQTYSRAKTSTTVFVLTLLCILLISVQGHNELRQGNAAVIIVLVICIILCLISLVLTFIQPVDKILPLTFLVQVPARSWVSLVTICYITLLLAAMETREWMIAVSWLGLGMVAYMIHVLCSHDSSYSDVSSHNAHSQDFQHVTSVSNDDTDDLHLATFTAKQNGGRDDEILVP